MLRQRARAFIKYFQRRKKSGRQRDNIDSSSLSSTAVLQMETFLNHDPLTTSRLHSQLLDSSSDDQEDYTVFAWNRKTGEWGGYCSDEEEQQVHGSLTLKSLTKWLWTKKSQDTTKMHFAHTAIPVCGSSSSSNGSDDESDTPLIGV